MFPYEEASWSAVDGAMFMGWGGALPGFATVILRCWTNAMTTCGWMQG